MSTGMMVNFSNKCETKPPALLNIQLKKSRFLGCRLYGVARSGRFQKIGINPSGKTRS